MANHAVAINILKVLSRQLLSWSTFISVIQQEGFNLVAACSRWVSESGKEKDSL
jgi:hypothetical protein